MKIDPDRTYKSSQVAAYFGITPDTLKKWWKKGMIHAMTINGHRYYRGSEIIRFETARISEGNNA